MKKIGLGSGEDAPASENLGDQTIGGVHATGTRMTTTIAAGTMGNEQPILVTSERLVLAGVESHRHDEAQRSLGW